MHFVHFVHEKITSHLTETQAKKKSFKNISKAMMFTKQEFLKAFVRHVD